MAFGRLVLPFAVVYNPCNAEYVRTKILTKGAVVMVDATPFRQWYAGHYGAALGVKKGKPIPEADAAIVNRTRSKAAQRKVDGRDGKVDSKIQDQVSSGRVMCKITSRPGQSGRCDGTILEGKELEFYQRKLKH